MTTPERIWIQNDTKNHLAELSEMAVRPVDEVLGAFAEYVRADIHATLRAEVGRLREAFNIAIARPMGVVPAGYDDLYDPVMATRATSPACQSGEESETACEDEG